MRRQFNWKAALILLAAIGLTGVTVHVVHIFQVKRQAGGLLTQADRAENEKNYAQALNYLRRYLGFQPQHTEVLARYARMMAREEVATTPAAKFSASQILESVLVRDPHLREERQRAVELYLDLGLAKEAQNHLEYLLKVDPNNAKLLGQLGKCHATLDRYREARDCFERALRASADQIDNVVMLAYLLREQAKDVLRPAKDKQPRETVAGLHQLADRLLDQFIQAHPHSWQGYLARAQYRRRYLLREGREKTLQEIERDLAQALDLAEDKREILLALAEVALEEGQVQRARSLLRDALDRYPNEWRIYQVLARLERGAGNLEAALVYLQKGVARFPDQIELLWDQAELLVDKGDETARAALEDLKTKGVPQAERDILSARLLVRDRKWADALKLLVDAYARLLGREDLLRSPRTLRLVEQCASLQARCYQELGDFHRAQAAYKRLLTRNPRSIEARLGVAMTHVALGANREAENQYAQLLTSTMVPVRAMVDHARLVLQRNLNQEQPDWEEVDEVLQRAEQLRPRPIEIILMRIDALAAQGKIQQAREVLACHLVAAYPVTLGLTRPELLLPVALPLQKPSARLWVMMALLEERSKRPVAAWNWLEEAHKRFPDSPEVWEARLNYFVRQGSAEALRYLQDLEAELPTFSTEEQRRLRRGLALAYTRLNQPDEAKKRWEALANQYPEDWSVRLVLFNLALEKNDGPTLDRLLQELRAIEKEDGVLWRDATLRRLLLQASKGDLSGLPTARKLVSDIASRWPGWVGVLLFEGQIEDLSGNQDLALKKYLEAINRGAGTVYAFRRAMEILYSQQRLQEANALRAKLPRDGDFSQGMSKVLALVSLQANDNAEAIARAEKAVSRDSTNYADHLFLGQLYWNAGQIDKAEAALRKAVQLNDTAPATWVNWISFLVANKRKELAQQELQIAEKKLSGLKGLLALAQCYEAIGDQDKAGKIYTSPEIRTSPDADARRALATHYLRIGDTKAAEQQLRYLIKAKLSQESVSWARGMLAVLASLGGNYTEIKDALANLDESKDRKSAIGVHSRRTQAAILASRGNRADRREAIRLLEGMLDEGVDQPQDRLLLAQLYEQNNDWPRARKQLIALRKMPRGNALPILVAYASAMLRHDELEEAEQALKQLDKADRDNLAAVVLQGQLLHRKGQEKEAVALLKGFAQRRGQAYGQIAYVLESLKEYRAAEELYRKHAEVSSNPTAQLAYAAFLGRQKRSKEALDICDRAWAKTQAAVVADTCLSILEAAEDNEEIRERVERQLLAALKREPRSPVLRLALANLRVLQHQYAEAEQLYRTLISENRDDQLARNNLAWMLTAQKGRLVEAEKWIDEAIAAGGPQALLLDTRAVVFLAAGKVKEAIAILEELVADSPKEAMYHLHLAQAYAADKNRLQALRSLQRARVAGLEPATLHPLERQGYERLLRDLGQSR